MNLTFGNLKKDSPVPLYYQIQELLIDQIEAGLLKAGDPVPSENQLARTLRVSKNTVIQALNTLESKRIVQRVRGRGTFVIDGKINRDATTLVSYSAEVIGLRKKTTGRLLVAEEIRANRLISQKLNMKLNARIYHIQRLREIDRLPTAFQTSYLPQELCPGLISHPLEEGSLFQILKDHYHLEVVSALETIQVQKADKYEASLLDIRINDPVFFIERCSTTQSGRVVEFVRTILRGDKYRFNLKIK